MVVEHRVLIQHANLDLDRVPLYHGRGYCLFKTLLSTSCHMDCRYCPLSRYSRVERTRWKPSDLVDAFLKAYWSRRVHGLFLTSTLYSDPDRVVEDELVVVEELRKRGYRGYIHLRLMPGVSNDLLFHAAVYSDRIGVNVEAPRDYFNTIAPSKADWLQDIIKRIEWLTRLRNMFRSRGYRRPGYISSGVDTQFVFGCSGESDRDVLETAWMLLKIGVERIYISGFHPYKNTPLEKHPPTPKWRTLRVTQAVELMRRYGYSFEEIKELLDDNGMLPNRDPKILYAELHRELYPVDLNNDPYELIVRVPGIGPKTARRIIEFREKGYRVDYGFLRRVYGDYRLKKIAKYIVL